MLFCIAGMHRSGTSMITRLLHVSGMYLGRQGNLLPPQPDNPEGFWENKGFVELNDRLLASLGGSWMDPPDMGENWVHSVHLEPIRCEAKRLLAPLRVRFFSGWKDPRNSLTLRFWRTIAPEVKVVVPLRHPLEVAQSLKRRNGLDLVRGMQLWYVYNMKLYQELDDSFYFLEYDNALKKPYDVLFALFRWAKISVPRRRMLEAIRTVRTDLRHHNHQRCRTDIPSGMAHVIDLYERLRENAEKLACPAEDSGSSRGRCVTQQDLGRVWSVPLSETPVGNGGRLRTPRTQPEEAGVGDSMGGVPGKSSRLFSGGKNPEASLCSIVIPVHNQWEYTDKCLRSIARCASAKVSFEVVVVNNGSADGTECFLDEARKRHPFLRVVHLEHNHGFAKACNVGARHARGTLLVFLNNDTVVLPGWLEALVDAHTREERAGIVGAKLLYPDGTIQHAGIGFRWIESGGVRYPWPVHLWRGVPLTAPQVNQRREMDAVTGACLLISKSLFEKVGGFDESYYMYFEDVDLNLKVRSLGKRVIYCPESVVIHFEGKSSPNQCVVDRLNNQSYRKFHERWGQVLNARAPLGKKNGLSPSPRRTGRVEACGTASAKTLRGIRWQSQVLSFSGHASHARRIIAALQQTGIPVSVQPTTADKRFIRHLTPSEVALWRDLMRKPVGQGAYLCFGVPSLEDGSDVFAAWREANPGFRTYVGLATFETDRLPPGWAEACNRMDEVWVPSTFNEETFARGGVDAERIHVFPTGIDADAFDPLRVSPLYIGNRRDFAFLSVFQWTYRKGWDILLRAYLSAFSPQDDVCLILRTYPYRIQQPPIRDRIEDYIRSLGLNPQETPPIILIDKFIPEHLMPSLYAAADAFVLPSRGEGFGLPYLEAMAMGLPVIATRWGGHLDFMNDANSFLIDVEDLLPVNGRLTSESTYYTGDQKLAEPSVSHTAELMRRVFDHKTEARRRGHEARRHVVRHWNMEQSAHWFLSRLSWITS
ncbi:Glycosyltransferase, GT2 family [Desulfacinum infernum DSM 9756]|uniref:Glycosyltransferase, GT2 family n=1 Tax=Desulfacinum infernum DSM 9756 TaxID=1121391 RepID=A0A1M5CSZ8_9BACT|nr:glycosyltransferase [Desulfacinum infernum]SHF57869.1 Glycosyltransferase, GT2 family [Desulfacinum infernum DSM 9756]